MERTDQQDRAGVALHAGEESRGSVGEVGDKEGGHIAQKEQQKKVSRNSLRELIERQQYRCALSGQFLSPSDASLDHIVPISKGGSLRDIENIQIVQSSINLMKGTMTQDEFISACKRVAEWNR